jgi:hypothetical protein
VLAIDCAGGVRAITSHAPAMEGGIAVAPTSFGRYGGDLVAPVKPADASSIGPVVLLVRTDRTCSPDVTAALLGRISCS